MGGKISREYLVKSIEKGLRWEERFLLKYRNEGVWELLKILDTQKSKRINYSILKLLGDLKNGRYKL